MSARTAHQRTIAPRNDAARERLRERERRHDELLAQIEAKQRAAEQAEQARRQAIYDAIRAARFAALRAQGHSLDLADHFAAKDARAAASREG